MTTTSLSPAEVRTLVAANPDVLLVDVRTPGEYENAHIAGSINLPLDQIDPHLDRIVADAGGTLVLVCQSGNRAGQCQRKLAEAGLPGTTVMAGGINEWAAGGGDVVRGRTRWELERQVRLAAGVLVLLGVVVSLWWGPARFFSGFIGAGLTFAALTNTCAMGMLIARMPWNRPAKPVDVKQALNRLPRTGIPS
ncbi:rhodanese-like domain-containing protein [Streptomyces durbertensis]|uniref:Rhodanese-like domain-containing protein n=1 Tax=Streptomyces durbertensis TaxID=2448886 RepID=A0ABR6E9G8_9ACTN|nr:rhodanese-like domain-containing protein [Streptomyces durbertensis]MBB1241983.1 rhodanese-like domain-containing protein [Streptomyces durbertensis]